MAEESAGQCGPCVLGLPALADTLAWAADGGGEEALEALHARLNAVKRRGACSHPDGTARLVESALDTFPEELEDHALGRGCGRPAIGCLAVRPTSSSPPAGAAAAAARGPAVPAGPR